MEAFDSFNHHINNLLLDMNKYKDENQYMNETNVFRKFIQENSLQNRVFKLSTDDIDNYFLYCKVNKKLNSKSTLNSHLAALKKIFDYLNKKDYDFNSQLGYISSEYFLNKIQDKINIPKSKELLSIQLLYEIMEKLDSEIGKIQALSEEKHVKFIVVGLYLKLNLLLPLKVSEMLDLRFSNFNENFHFVEVNNIKIKIPKSFRQQIYSAIQLVQKKHTSSERFFDYFSSTQLNTSLISRWFYFVLKSLRFYELISHAKKDSFPVERIKKSAINELINSKVSLFYLSSLTKLKIEALITNYKIILDPEHASYELNTALFHTNYYEKL